MGVYTEKKRQLIEKIKDYDAHIRSNMEKKKKAMENFLKWSAVKQPMLLNREMPKRLSRLLSLM